MANFSNSSSNSTYSTDFWNAYIAEYNKMIKFVQAVWILMFTLGTCANLWMIVCIWKSPDLRVKFRNQLLCNLLCVHLLSTLVLYPMGLILYFRLLKLSVVYCRIFEIRIIFDVAQNFLGDWLLVTILAVFLAQVFKCDLETKLSPTRAKIGRVVLHLWPWVVGTTALIPPLYALNKTHSSWSWCIRVGFRYRYRYYEIASTIIPLAMSIIMVIVATVLRLPKLRRGIPSTYENMESQLIERNPERDSSLPYAAAVALAVILEILQVMRRNGFYPGIYWGLHFHFASGLISDCRPLFMVFPWLLLSDIRERIKTWRPWRNSAPSGIDLTVVYTKEA